MSITDVTKDLLCYVSVVLVIGFVHSKECSYNVSSTSEVKSKDCENGCCARVIDNYDDDADICCEEGFRFWNIIGVVAVVLVILFFCFCFIKPRARDKCRKHNQRKKTGPVKINENKNDLKLAKDSPPPSKPNIGEAKAKAGPLPRRFSEQAPSKRLLRRYSDPTLPKTTVGQGNRTPRQPPTLPLHTSNAPWRSLRTAVNITTIWKLQARKLPPVQPPSPGIAPSGAPPPSYQSVAGSSVPEEDQNLSMQVPPAYNYMAPSEVRTESHTHGRLPRIEGTQRREPPSLSYPQYVPNDSMA